MTIRRKTVLALGAIGAGCADPMEASAMTLEQRLEAMERKMSQMESKLERSEAENQQLKKRLAVSASDGTGNEVKSVADKVAVLERRLDSDRSLAAEAAKKLPKIEVTNSGVTFKSTDENYKLNLRGYAQADGNFFMDDSSAQDGNAIADKFAIRRARLTLDGTLWKNIDFRLSPDFAGSTMRLFDAFVDLHYFPYASLMAGKFRQPVSLERHQSATNLVFMERGYPAQMSPNRDVGVMLHGAISYPGYQVQYTPQPVFKEFLGYELGVFNGVRDNQGVGNAESEKDDNKEFAGRVFAHPFLHSGGFLEGLGLGVAGTWGVPRDNNLFGFQSPGQQTVFSYDSTGKKTVTASGDHYRVYPQMYWYYGPFGFMGEYVYSSQHLHGVDTAAPKKDVALQQNNQAWNAAASYMLTGEDNTFFAIKPSRNFDPQAGTWGAFQLAARWTEMEIDDSTFKNAANFTFADPKKSISKASTWSLGMNWFLNQNAKLMADYEQTHFTGGAAAKDGAVADRPTEKVFMTRFQYAF